MFKTDSSNGFLLKNTQKEIPKDVIKDEKEKEKKKFNIAYIIVPLIGIVVMAEESESIKIGTKKVRL